MTPFTTMTVSELQSALADGASSVDLTRAYLDRIAIPYHPRVIVVYAGDNDLWAGKSPATVAADFEAFCAKIVEEIKEGRHNQRSAD